MDNVIGVDVGGTFTDFFLSGPKGTRSWKRLSTPSSPEQSVIEGLAEVEDFARLVHGSTVATNALLERRGPRTCLVTTEGFGDLLEIRRQMRPRIYELEPHRNPHVVRRGDFIEVRERLDHLGEVMIELTDVEIERVVDAARSSGCDAFAICFLYSFRSWWHEFQIAGALREAGFEVCASHEVVPEYREYERGSTTAINAFLRPSVRGYLGRLEAAVGRPEAGASRLRVMHSAGGVASAAAAGELPVSMVMSGPAGGVLGALAVAKAAGFENIITFDMGGTSTDVSLCLDGKPQYRNAAEIDGLAVHTPMIDVITVGAGGGSIARIDEGGALVVGPESAGADPGPACYGRGTRPTVSDANVVAGRLRPEQPLAGSLLIDSSRAATAIAGLGEVEAAANGVVAVVNANMARALRTVSLERGFDPADFTMVAFGGAGPLHACELAAEAGIARVLVPRHPGVLSALGMATARGVVERSIGLLLAIDPDGKQMAEEPDYWGASYNLLPDTVGAAEEAGLEVADSKFAADMRYLGQGHELRVDWDGVRAPSLKELADTFHAVHERRYGYASRETPVELVTLRCRVAEAPPTALQESATPAAPSGSPPPATGSDGMRLVRRDSLRPDDRLTGPAVVIQDDATTYIADNWQAKVDPQLNLIIEPIHA